MINMYSTLLDSITARIQDLEKQEPRETKKVVLAAQFLWGNVQTIAEDRDIYTLY